MVDFQLALPNVLRNEGGYSNVNGDTGGETYRGISRNNFPEWSGWLLIDEHKPLHDEQIIQDEAISALVYHFYKDNFWLPNKLDQLQDQSIANKLLDMCVNMGSSRGIKILQQSLANDFRHAISIDGNCGSETIRYTNQESGSVLLQKLRDRCAAFYQGLADMHENDKQFLHGWLARARQ